MTFFLTASFLVNSLSGQTYPPNCDCTATDSITIPNNYSLKNSAAISGLPGTNWDGKKIRVKGVFTIEKNLKKKEQLDENLNWALVDLSGRTLLTGIYNPDSESVTISVGHILSGFYILQMKSASGVTFAKPLIIAR